MANCISCGNSYDKTFDIIMHNQSYTFDCFECAIDKLAPHCKHCNCKIIGHGIEAHGSYFCCAHCAKQVGIINARDNV